MALHFTRDEFAERRRRACAEMQKSGLYGLLIFRQESLYYLTGYDTSGYSMFQGLYLGADGALALLTRSADQRQARITSVIEAAGSSAGSAGRSTSWGRPSTSPPRSSPITSCSAAAMPSSSKRSHQTRGSVATATL